MSCHPPIPFIQRRPVHSHVTSLRDECKRRPTLHQRCPRVQEVADRNHQKDTGPRNLWAMRTDGWTVPAIATGRQRILPTDCPPSRFVLVMLKEDITPPASWGGPETSLTAQSLDSSQRLACDISTSDLLCRLPFTPTPPNRSFEKGVLDLLDMCVSCPSKTSPFLSHDWLPSTKMTPRPPPSAWAEGSRSASTPQLQTTTSTNH